MNSVSRVLKEVVIFGDFPLIGLSIRIDATIFLKRIILFVTHVVRSNKFNQKSEFSIKSYMN